MFLTCWMSRGRFPRFVEPTSFLTPHPHHFFSFSTLRHVVFGSNADLRNITRGNSSGFTRLPLEPQKVSVKALFAQAAVLFKMLQTSRAWTLKVHKLIMCVMWALKCYDNTVREGWKYEATLYRYTAGNHRRLKIGFWFLNKKFFKSFQLLVKRNFKGNIQCPAVGKCSQSCAIKDFCGW